MTYCTPALKTGPWGHTTYSTTTMKDDKVNYVSEEGLATASSSVDEGKLFTSDDTLLMSMGKKPELRRVYNFWTCKSF